MRIETIAIDRINPATYNPRVDLRPGDQEYEKLKRSIMEFGYIDPIVWNERTGNMVGGHQRFKIMVDELGMTEIAVSVVDLDLEREKLLNLALNKVSGRWDDEALSDLLDELRTSGVDLLLSGFDPGEVDRLIEEFAEPPDDIAGDFINRELNADDFDKSQFDCECPRCGFVFDKAGGAS
ncbi:transcriptional regulator [Paenibacillus mesophilus]|uniref:ParB N-terminal domain-containing protein n=1 Tax=Paenibacillus mesophilus TaxID=2582849 RepID=UPI00110DFF26|nr:ParB N-terminal domain-containing protein [Paenibacillus mesophilus]TMV49376.1 transcriptional regulator [Paenibacillus mesophilus]